MLAPLLCVGTVLAAPPSVAADVTTVIDFDSAAGNVSLPDDTYASLGVHIADAWVWRGGGTEEYPYFSGIQRIVPDRFEDPAVSAVDVTFDQGVSEVGGWFAGPAGRTAWFTCTDGSGATIATSGLIVLNGTSYVYHSVTAPGIRSCSFTGEGGGSLFLLDNLTFVTPGSTATAPAAPTAPMLLAENAEVEVYWGVPDNGGSEIVGYTVAYKAVADSEWTTRTTGTTTWMSVSGLTNGTTYEFKVLATNSVGDGPYSAVSTATPAFVPGAPTDLQATPGNAQVGLTWTAPDNGGSEITGYTVAYKGAGDWVTTTSATTSTTITGLANGYPYEFKVLATNILGPGPYSSVVTATPFIPASVPAAPAAPVAVAGNGQVELTWTAPDDGGAAIIDYTIKVAYNVGGSVVRFENSTTTSKTITGLTNGTAYEFSVLAANSVGSGPWSPYTIATPAPTVPAAPGAPGVMQGNAEAELFWAAPDDGGAAIISYTVAYKAVAASEWMTQTTNAIPTTRVTGLTNGTTYEFKVRATNSVGDGPYSAVSTVTPATVPGAPGTPIAVPGNGQVELSWTAPADDGGAAITGYRVNHRAVGDSIWQPTSTSTTSTTITGLTNGTAYEFRVLAMNSAGESAYSTIVTATPVAPATVPGAPSDLQATPGTGQVELTWTAPDNGGAEIIGYTVAYKGAGDWVTTTSTSTSTTVTGLDNGYPYEFKVLATNSVGDGPYSSVVTATPFIPASVPGAPSDLQATPGTGQVELTWTAPDNGGAEIIGYTVAYKGAGDWVTTTSTSTSTTVTGLDNGYPYEFKVLATNSVGDGPYSSVVTATPFIPASVPGAPSDLQATPGNGQVELTWTAPADGGAAITGYTVAYKAVADSEWLTTTSATTSKTVTGLANGTAYEFKVLATNSVGDGPYSSVVTATPVAPTFDVLEAIAHLRADVVALDLGKAEKRLTVLLDNAAMNVRKGDLSGAAVKMDSFINTVEAMTSGGKKVKDLTPGEADHLIQHAEVIIQALTS